LRVGMLAGRAGHSLRPREVGPQHVQASRSRMPIRTRRASGSSPSTRCCACTARSARTTARAPDRLHAPARVPTAVQAEHGLREHHRDPAGAGVSGRPGRSRSAIKAYIRWNAMAMVVQANRQSSEFGGTSPPTPRRRRSTRSASITSGARRTRRIRRQWCSSRTLLARIYARAYLEEGSPRSTCGASARGGRRRPCLVPAPVADAGLLAVPDGVHGPSAP